MTPEQRYLLDINGYLVIKDAVEPAVLAAARTAAYGATERQRLAVSTGTQDHRWDLFSDPALSALAFTPAAWPVVMELTRNQPMIRLGIGLHVRFQDAFRPPFVRVSPFSRPLGSGRSCW